MPLCITCSYPLPHLYTIYSKADDRTLGKGVRLTQCPNCKRFADKYVEHDYVVLFIDLVLIKPQVYRHLLFNRLNTSLPSKDGTNRLDPSILRLGTLLILFDVYITWARIEKGSSTNTDDPSTNGITSWPIVVQYLFFLTLNIAATLAQHFTIRNLAHYFVGNSSPQSQTARWATTHSRSSSNVPGMVTTTAMTATNPFNARDPIHHNNQVHSRHTSQETPITSPTHQNHITTTTSTSTTTAANNNPSIPEPPLDPPNPHPGHATPSAISTAILVSSCTKLFPILLVIWPTTTTTTTTDSTSPPSSSGPFATRAASYIGWVVLINNIEALLILLDCGYAVTTGLAVAGLVARWVVEGWVLGFVGLQRDGRGPVGDVLGVVGWCISALRGG